MSNKWNVLFEKNGEKLPGLTEEFGHYPTAKARFESVAEKGDADKVWLCRQDGTALNVKEIKVGA